MIRIRIQLKQDGTLSATADGADRAATASLYNPARDSAVRAVFAGQPYDMLKPEHYETWKDIEVTFDPRDMFRG